MDIMDVRAELMKTEKDLKATIVDLVDSRFACNAAIKEAREELAKTQRFLAATRPRAAKKAKATAQKATPLETGI